MSSFFGHALIGVSLGDNSNVKSGREKSICLAIFAFLAVCPDLDYLPTWLFNINMEPRYSHSILACLLIGGFAVFLKYFVFKNSLRSTNNLLLVAAPITHITLDYFVGVHKNPILWPISQELLAFGHGVLPSAGKIDLRNFYFWRNLGIEMGILIPLSVFISPTLFNAVSKKRFVLALFVFVGVVCAFIGYRLHR